MGIKLGKEHVGEVRKFFENTAIGVAIKRLKGYEYSIDWFSELMNQPLVYISKYGLYEFIDILTSKEGQLQAKIIVYPIDEQYQNYLYAEAQQTAFEELRFTEVLYSVVVTNLILITKKTYDDMKAMVTKAKEQPKPVEEELAPPMTDEELEEALGIAEEDDEKLEEEIEDDGESRSNDELSESKSITTDTNKGNKQRSVLKSQSNTRKGNKRNRTPVRK